MILKFGIPITISGVLGAIGGAMIAGRLDVNQLKKYFGYFLLIIAIWEIYYLIKKYKEDKKRDNKGINKN